MKLNKFLSFFLITAFVIPLLFSCNAENSNITEDSGFLSSSETPSSSLGSEESTEESVQSQIQNEIPNESSEIEEEIIIPQDSVVSFFACPDNLIHPSLYYNAIEKAAVKNGVQPDYSDLHNAEYDFSPMYEYIKNEIVQADIAYINQESLIGGDCKPISAYPQFNTPVPMAKTLADLGFDIVNVAHNHMLDSGDTRYLEYCSSLFEGLGVNVLGYYPNEKSTDDIMIIEKNGIKIAFLTYTYGTNGIRVPSKSDVVVPYFDDALIEHQVEIAKANADVIIASCHWGNEYQYNPNSMQKQYAKKLCELGVDIILGMHPHCIQPVEWMTSESGSKTLVVYSLGTMISGIRKGMSALAGILSLEIRKDGETGEISIESPLFIPTVAHYERGRSIASNDTGSREFTIYYLADYTQELAKKHGIIRAEQKDGTTLVGGGFSLETLFATIEKYIDPEFLPQDFKEKQSELTEN